jgi:hypothetical protein
MGKNWTILYDEETGKVAGKWRNYSPSKKSLKERDEARTKFKVWFYEKYQKDRPEKINWNM